MLEYLKNKKILVVVAHPDDEVLGNGATMHKLIREYNCTIRAIILGEGLTSRTDERDLDIWKEKLEQHRQNIYNAQKCIGYESIGIYNFPDNRFDSVDLLDIIKIVEKEKNEFRPDVIFTHHSGDLNIDHQRTFEAVLTSTRPMNNENVESIITFETPSGTEWQAINDPRRFLPNLFVQVSEENIEAKVKAIESYDFEKREFPHPRSAEALRILAQRYGIMMGASSMEAFQIIRMNIKQ